MIIFLTVLFCIIAITCILISIITKITDKINVYTEKSVIVRKQIDAFFDKPKPQKIVKTQILLKQKKIKLIETVVLIADTILYVIYKEKYERLKDWYDFIKNTMA